MTSPGLETCDQSIFGLGSASALAPPEPDPLPLFRKYPRTRSASSPSSELECVFFSTTPTSVSESRIALLLTSSSRAKSLIRTLLIRPFALLPPSLFRHVESSRPWVAFGFYYPLKRRALRFPSEADSLSAAHGYAPHSSSVFGPSTFTSTFPSPMASCSAAPVFG
jgi:hypothetical protein